jgi:hypothetical protein
MKEFKKGDRVRVSVPRIRHSGKIGTVTRITRDYWYRVKIPNELLCDFPKSFIEKITLLDEIAEAADD